MTHWRYVGSCVDSEPFEIEPGVNVWDHRWEGVLRDPLPAPTGDDLLDMAARFETVPVKDPSHGTEFAFRVFEIAVGGRRIRFAAQEFSNTIFGFFVPP